MSFFRKRRPYIADGTTWTCKACNKQAWVQGDIYGCGCPNDLMPRPLVADDPKHWSNQRAFDEGEYELGGDNLDAPMLAHIDPRDELVATMQAQVETLQAIVERQAQVTSAARHLMTVLGMRSASGVTLFKLNEGLDEEHEAANILILRHAIMGLQAQLDGVEAPPLALPDTERVH